MFIKDKVKVASRVGCSERRVVYIRKLLFKSDEKKLSFRRVECKKVCRFAAALYECAAAHTAGHRPKSEEKSVRNENIQ